MHKDSKKNFPTILIGMSTKSKILCIFCNQYFDAENKYLKRGHAKYCSKICSNASKVSRVDTRCFQCEKPISVVLSTKKEHNFCTKSCAATYNNRNKKFGTNRSKLEIWLEKELTGAYPELEFHFNRKNAINSELDIYIPKLKLAFELNGLFHYEPIFGPDKLSQIQNNDSRKYQACLERQIELCIIDTSQLKNFKEQRAKQYLDIINQVVSRKLS